MISAKCSSKPASSWLNVLLAVEEGVSADRSSCLYNWVAIHVVSKLSLMESRCAAHESKVMLKVDDVTLSCHETSVRAPFDVDATVVLERHC